MGKVIPRLPIWVDDMLAHIAETREPTLATGARFRLWLIARRTGGRLRADDEALAQWSGVTEKQWEQVKPFIVGGWRYDDETNTYVIRRIEEEIERAADLSAKQRANAERRWNATAMPRQCDGIANAMPPPAPAPAPALKREFSCESPPENSAPAAKARRDLAPESVETIPEDEDPVTESQVQEVYRFYLSEMGLTPASYKLTRTRRAKIRTRLSEYTIDAIKTAIHACRSSPFHMGEDPRSPGICNDLIKNILCSEEKVEWWIRRGKNGNGKAKE